YSRFYTTVTGRSPADSQPNTISVRSPRFEDGLWEYRVRGALDPSAAASTDFASRFGSGLDILIVGHNDFYSQRPQLDQLRLPLTTHSLYLLPPFCPTLTTIANVHKTGLGSSADMITSLMTSLLVHFGVVSLPEDVQLAHNMSQFVHCLAQGKVGSGFDVSSAVFGSHLYRRFAPVILEQFMADCDARGVGCVSGKEILEVVDREWDSRVEPVRLPRGVRLMLADVDAGSSTPKLVSGVLGWRKQNPVEAKALWQELDQENMEVAKTLVRISALAVSGPEVYDEAVRICASSRGQEWNASINEVVKLFGHVFDSFMCVRTLLQKMSILADVPVEPASQTRLLDSLANLNGVLMAGVPGAGGFDAIFVLVIEDPEREGVNRAGVESVWSQWTESKVGPLLAGDSVIGVCVEEVAKVDGLLSSLLGNAALNNVNPATTEAVAPVPAPQPEVNPTPVPPTKKPHTPPTASAAAPPPPPATTAPAPAPAPQPDPETTAPAPAPVPQPETSNGPNTIANLISETAFNNALSACGITKPGLYAGLTGGFTAPLSGMKELALLMGNTAHESGSYQFTEEIRCAGVTTVTADCPYGWYHGRGYIQLSWDSNYAAAAAALNNPSIHSNPDLVMTDMSVNWATVQWYWTTSVQSLLKSSGVTLGNSVKAINGPLECASLGGKGIATQRVTFIQCFEQQFTGSSSDAASC
ncbi:phosphomevalonate kinase, partial [Podochytrium sp. JEL0797]